MGRAYRMAGAIVAATGADHYLIGHTKVPCDFASYGFESPGEVDVTRTPFCRLGRAGPAMLGGTFLELDLEGEALARALADRFLVARNGSVSERLWRLIVCAGDPDADPPACAAIDARWLGAMPPAIWAVVRDAVLRCV